MIVLRNTVLAAVAAVLIMAAPATAADYAEEYIGGCCYETLEPGDRVEQYLDVKNVGTKTWFREGAIPVRLGASNPMDRSSPFFTDGDWISPARMTGLDALTVEPGQPGRFTWIATAPQAVGTYDEFFAPLAETITWMNPGNVYFFKYTVIPAQAPTVRITGSPARISRGGAITVSADATDNRKVAAVTFAVGTQSVTVTAPTQGTSGYAATLSSQELAPGTHSVQVKATDPGGRESSALAAFEVYEPPPPVSTSTRLSPFQPVFTTRSGRGGRLGTLYAIGPVTGLRPGARLSVVCTSGCVRRLSATRTASGAGRAKVTLRRPQRLLRTTRIELRQSVSGYVTRFQRYRFRRTSAGTFGRFERAGCLASEKPRQVVRCPAP